MKIFMRRYDEDWIKCPECRWSVTRLFTLAETKEEANKIFDAYEKERIGALCSVGVLPACSDCMIDVLLGDNYLICTDPHLILKPSEGDQKEEAYKIYLAPDRTSKELVYLGKMQDLGQVIEGKILIEEEEE